ncbi:hypothetical protein [Arthrobacter sp. NPDC093139]|uniref:hypothetical protein n=1 Tax=Arthrobacter sp. NPDC093139 TaxID=3363945 RepID=UPI0038194FF1
MTAASYAPGSWFGILRSGTAVILGPESEPALVRKVWGLLQGQPEVHEVLHAVTGGLGAPLSRCPQFGIIGFRESLRVFLRGDLDLTVHLEGGMVALDGRNVTTWTERWLDSPEWFSLTIPGAPGGQAGLRSSTAPELPALELPVGEGVFLLQALRLAMAGDGTGAGGGAGAAAVTLAAVEASSETMAALPVATVEAAAGPEPAVAGEAVSDETSYQAVSDETVSGQAESDETVSDETVFDQTRVDAVVPDEPQPDELALEEDGRSAEVLQPARELTGSYDHLWDKTVVRSIEGAAVRTGEGADEDLPEAAAASHGAPHIPDAAEAPDAGAPETGPDEILPPESPSAETQSPETQSPETQSPEIQSPPTKYPEAGPAGNAAAGGLIDSVPWATRSDSGQRPPAPPSFTPMSARPETAADKLQPEPVHPEAPATPADGDHDGQTVLKSELRAASAQPQTASGAAPGGGPLGAGPLVLARVCAAGHANPPTNGQCSTCGAPLPDVGVQVPRPRLGQVRLSTGEVIGLDESLVIGRQPSVSRVQGGAMPRLVQVASPGGDISRSHIEVRLEGWHVMLCDLKATNGTVLVREGQPPRRLAQNEMAIVLDGDIAELGDDVSLRFEEIL